MKRLDEIEARTTAATEGPWGHGQCVPCGERGRLDVAIWGRNGNALITSWRDQDEYDPEDAEFIAHARADVPALVAVARYALSQHAPDGRGNCGPCDDATGEDGWPCSTVREIHRLLGEEA